MRKNRNKNLTKLKFEEPQESVEKLRSIFAASPDAIAVMDLKGTIIDCNKAALEMCGRKSKQDLIGKSAFELIAKKDRKRAKENMKKTLTQGSLRNIEYTFLSKNGVEHSAELSASVVKDSFGNPSALVTIVKDITERKEAEMTLRESQQKFERLFMRNPEAAFYADAKWHIIDINPRFTQLFGYKKDEAIGKRTSDLLVPRNKKQESAMLGKKSKTGHIYYETVRKRKGGSLLAVSISVAPVKVDGRLIGYVGLYKDVTEHKRMEEQLKRYSERLQELVKERTRNLQESEKRFRNLVETAPVIIYTLSANGKITSLNPAFKKIAGWSRSECIDKPFAKFVHPEDSCKATEMFKKVKHGKTPQPYQLRIVSKSGKYLVCEFISTPLIENEKIAGEFGIAHDITDRKKAELELERSLSLLHATIESTADGILVVDRDGKITSFNRKFAEMWHIPNSILVSGKDEKAQSFVMDQLNDPDELRKKVRELYADQDAESFDIIEFKDGRIFERYSMPQKIGGKTVGRVWSFRDITERKRHEERLSILSIYGTKLNSAKNFQEIYELTLDAMKQTLGFEYATFMIVKKGKLEGACQRGYQKPTLVKLPLDGTQRGITVKSANTRSPIIVPDVRKNRDYVGAVSIIRSELAVPIEIEDEVFGVLNVESTKLDAFDDKDVKLLQILASHAATAINSLKKRDEIEKRINQQASLMKSSTEMIHSTDLRQRLQAILDAIQGLGWRRVVLSVRDENLDIARLEDIVAAGLTDKEREFLWTNKQPGQVWAERFGSDFARFRIGEFYYLPWSDAFVRKKFTQGTVESHLSSEEMVDWNPDDLLYAPLRLADGRIVGVVSMDDPVDGRRPTRESLAPLELFLHQAAVAIENARLIKQLNDANIQIQEYAGKLEVKVAERTRELIEAQNKLLKAERLAAIGQLAGMVGHDLRNPLTGIAGATYYLKTKYASKMNEKGKEMIKIIEQDIEYSNKIISDLLDYSRELHLEFTESTVELIVKEAVAQVKVPKRVKISKVTQNDLKIKVDKEKMKRVFVNIIKNAVDAMPNGGTLTIRSKVLDGNMKVAFKDTGEGIKKDVLEKLWSPFFTTKAKGMGLGLPICKRIVEAHGGKISVESRFGKGTTFTVIFPVEPCLEGGEKVWVKMPELLLSTTTKA